jgi:hypothetical protein
VDGLRDLEMLKSVKAEAGCRLVFNQIAAL